MTLLALQAYRLGDPLLADNLIGTALAGDLSDAERRAGRTWRHWATLLRSTGPDRAEELVERLLKDTPTEPVLWRLASRLAEELRHTEPSIVCLERALDLEYAALPEVIELQGWRNDYRRLLSHYRSQAEALTASRAPLPADLAAKTVRAADRWRAHDPEADEASRLGHATRSSCSAIANWPGSI